VYRRTIAIVSGALLAGGTLAYAQSGRRRNSHSDSKVHTGNGEQIHQNGLDGKLVKTRKKKNGLKSLHFLAAILLKKLGPNGTNYLLGLMITAVSSNFCLSCSFPLFVMLIMQFRVSEHECTSNHVAHSFAPPTACLEKYSGLLIATPLIVFFTKAAA
jgi:hypothetical protein